jgi:hypothetical protein
MIALAGCGGAGPPRLRQADAAPLIALARQIAHEDPCGQTRDIAKLRARAIALVNAGRVPGELQEPLMSGVSALGADTPICLAKVTPAAPSPKSKPEPGRRPAPEPRHRHEHGHGHEEKG